MVVERGRSGPAGSTAFLREGNLAFDAAKKKKKKKSLITSHNCYCCSWLNMDFYWQHGELLIQVAMLKLYLSDPADWPYARGCAFLFITSLCVLNNPLKRQKGLICVMAACAMTNHSDMGRFTRENSKQDPIFVFEVHNICDVYKLQMDCKTPWNEKGSVNSSVNSLPTASINPIFPGAGNLFSPSSQQY